jgi:hypothetical protein
MEGSCSICYDNSVKSWLQSMRSVQLKCLKSYADVAKNMQVWWLFKFLAFAEFTLHLILAPKGYWQDKF